MKTYYPIQIIDLRFQIDHKSSKKNRLFEESDENPVNIDFQKNLKKIEKLKCFLMVIKLSVFKLYKINDNT